jgi:hypothetical protein
MASCEICKSADTLLLETISFINGFHLLDDAPEDFEENEKVDEELVALKGGEALNEITEEQEHP